jgi:hypothetical protein
LFSHLEAQKPSSVIVDKLVYPGVVFGTTIDPATCLLNRHQAVPYDLFMTGNSIASGKCYIPERNMNKFIQQYLNVRRRLLDHLLA